MGWGKREQLHEMRVSATIRSPNTCFCLHPFVHWMARPYPNRHLPRPCLLSVFAVSSVVHRLRALYTSYLSQQGHFFPSWDHPQVKQKLKGATGLSILQKRLRCAHLARIPTRKTEPLELPEGAPPGEKVGGTEASTSAPLAFGRTTPCPGPGRQGGVGVGGMDTWCGTKMGRRGLIPAKGELARTGGDSLRAWSTPNEHQSSRTS